MNFWLKPDWLIRPLAESEIEEKHVGVRRVFRSRIKRGCVTSYASLHRYFCCAVLTPPPRGDFCPKHKDCLHTAGYAAVHPTGVASGHRSADVDMLACTMPACAMLSLRRKPWCTPAGKELRCSEYTGRDGCATRPTRCIGEFVP